MECKNCHSEMPDGYKFCTNCGAPLRQPEPAPEEQTQSSAAQPRPGQPEPMPQQAAPERPANTSKSHGNVLPWVIAGIAGLAAIVLLVLFLVSNKKDSSASDISADDREWLENVSVENDSIEYVDYPQGSPAGWVSLIELVRDNNQGVTNVYGTYTDGDTSVPVRIFINARKNGSEISISGTATYRNDVEYDLSGDGHFDSDGDIACVLKEYSSDGSYTGKWDGWITTEGRHDRFWGSFYDNQGNRICRFNLLED